MNVAEAAAPAASDAPRPAIVLIGGPTAAGKTTLGVGLAQALDGEVISADSVQLYRGFRIGAATPSLAERDGVPHHLIDMLPPDANISAADFAELADRAIAEVHGRGKTPILVGGSGLYLRALLYGLVEAPPRDDALRAELEAFADARGDRALWESLREVDAESAARLHENDRLRVVRALEVFRLTGRSIQHAQDAHGFQELRYPAVGVGLTAARPWLHARIDRRAQAMVHGGLVEEVEALLGAGVPETAHPFGAIGYRETLEHLRAQAANDDAHPLATRQALAEQIATNTRNFARRQLVWFRKEPRFRWFDAKSLESDAGAFVAQHAPAVEAALKGAPWQAGEAEERAVSGTAPTQRRPRPSTNTP